jgi:hypothetical protein
MLVSTALLTFIVLGLTAVFVQTQKAFKTGIKSTTVTDAGRTIMEMVASDVRQMSDGNSSPVTNLPFVTNLYCGWPSNGFVNYINNNVPFRTNQLDSIYILEHTNNMWIGVGYAVQGAVGGVGTLYRFQTNYGTPFLSNDFIRPFMSSVTQQTFTNKVYWHRVADGVIDFKLQAYDQFGNNPWANIDYSTAGNFISYPSISYPFGFPIISNTLPNTVQLELAILEPDALVRARSLAGAPIALENYLQTNSLTAMEVFRQRISIPVVAR